MNAQQAATPVSLPVVPQLVNFSGTAVDAQGKAISGAVGVTFAIYKDQYEGVPLWMETQNVTVDSKGNYTAQLGATTSSGLPLDLFSTGEARWLGVRINGGQEQPRVLLLSVPYALKAADAQTLGGLPASAFVLAAPVSGSSAGGGSGVASSSSSDSQAVSPATAVTGSGTTDYVPLWTGASTVGNSVLFQLGSGSTAKVGINTTTPGATLDVKGSEFVRGTLALVGSGAGTAAAGKNSYPLNLTASVFSSGTGTAVGQTFRWQAEPAGNNTASPAATMNLLFASGAATPAETGLKIASNGQITFASGQTFPGIGAGTITSVTAGTDLTGGGTSGSVTLNLDTTKVPLLAASNTFTGNQTVNGNLSATGVVSGSSFEIGSNLFAFGSYALNNAFLGFAGNSTMTGGQNTATGDQALYFNTTGYNNTANGYGALVKNTTGFNNTASGYGALLFNTSGSDNTAAGVLALESNTTTGNNTAIGYGALQSSTASSNTAIGAGALLKNTIACCNTAVGTSALGASNATVPNDAFGFGALQSNTTGGDNDAFGYQALASNTTGLANAAFGFQALASNTTVSDNNAFGYWALNANSTGGQNGAFGTGALLSNTSGTGNNAFGYIALEANTSGSGNSAFGYQALVSNTFVGGNDAFGYQALYSNTDGNPNSAFGYQALYANVDGEYNDAFGFQALYSNTNGSGGAAFGYQALYANTTGYDNTGLGIGALLENTTGAANTAVGYGALDGNKTGNSITCIGYECDTSSDSLENATAIGAHAKVGQSNSLVLGGTGEYAVKVGIGTTTPSSILTVAQGAGHPVSDSWETYSSRRWKTNIQTLPNALAKVQQLRGVSYDLKVTGKHEIGVIAEEVGAVVPELVSYEANGKDARSVDYARLTALLIEATKDQQRELQRQQSLLKTQAAAIRDLKLELRATRQSLQKIKAQMSSTQPVVVAGKSSAKIQVR
jgi:hypothetical protein